MKHAFVLAALLLNVATAFSQDRVNYADPKMSGQKSCDQDKRSRGTVGDQRLIRTNYMVTPQQRLNQRRGNGIA